jgi:hypothetical protein
MGMLRWTSGRLGWWGLTDMKASHNLFIFIKLSIYLQQNSMFGRQ